MLTFSIYLLAAVMVVDCLLLTLLVLVQLPKKDLGAGQAFGVATTDVLFGAGSGNALTKITKWCAVIFFVLAIALTVLANYQSTSRQGRLPRLLSATQTLPVAMTTVVKHSI